MASRSDREAFFHRRTDAVGLARRNRARHLPCASSSCLCSTFSPSAPPRPYPQTASRPPAMATSSPASDYAELRVRSLLWRLPLVAVVLIGLISLKYLDGLLKREYANEAQTQAVQTDALLESFLRHRFALIHSERALIATATTRAESRERVGILANQIMADAPDMFSLYLLDASGAVTDAVRREGDLLQSPRTNHFDIPERAEALNRARAERRPAVTRTITLVGGAKGM